MKNSSGSIPATLDEIDFALIKALELDARKGYQELATEVGTTTTMAWRRLQRLVNEQIITFATISNARTLGFSTLVAIGINTAPCNPDALADQLTAFPNVQQVNLITGRYDMLLTSVHRTQSELVTFLDEQLAHAPNVTHAEAMIILKHVKRAWQYLIDPHDTSKENLMHRELTLEEQELIRQLEIDPRSSLTALGKAIGMSRTSAARKLQKLLDENALEVVVIPNSAKLGFGTQAGIFIRVSPGRINAVAQALSEHNRIHHVVLTAGYFDIILWGFFRDPSELSDFIRTCVANQPGVLSYETMLDISVPRQTYALLA